MRFTLPDGVKSAMDIFEHVREVDYYPNIFVAYRIMFTVPVTVGLFKVEIIEELFEINNDSTEVKRFANIMHREEIIR
jgi:hypothetical protein